MLKLTASEIKIVAVSAVQVNEKGKIKMEYKKLYDILQSKKEHFTTAEEKLALRNLFSAIARDNPVIVEYDPEIDDKLHPTCPFCDSDRVQDDYDLFNYCGDCGRRLDFAAEWYE